MMTRARSSAVVLAVVLFVQGAAGARATEPRPTAEEPVPLAGLPAPVTLTPSAPVAERQLLVAKPDHLDGWYLTRTRMDVHLVPGTRGKAVLSTATNGDHYSAQVLVVSDGRGVTVDTLGLWDGRRTVTSRNWDVSVDFTNYVPESGAHPGANRITYRLEALRGIEVSRAVVGAGSGIQWTAANPYELKVSGQGLRLTADHPGELRVRVTRAGGRPARPGTVTLDGITADPKAGLRLTDGHTRSFSTIGATGTELRFPLAGRAPGRYSVIAHVDGGYNDPEVALEVEVVAASVGWHQLLPSAVGILVGVLLLGLASVLRRHGWPRQPERGAGIGTPGHVGSTEDSADDLCGQATGDRSGSTVTSRARTRETERAG